jgi:dienelactone hydrolase
MLEPQSRSIDLPGVELSADLRLPARTQALVIFVHGSGSGRTSPRNQYVADFLARRGLGSLLFDLLTESEQRMDNLTGELRFDIPLLARRLIQVIDWAGRDPGLRALRIGLFGASTGAAPAAATLRGGCPWWNSGASHMNQALPKKRWDRLGLVSILDTINGLSA